MYLPIDTLSINRCTNLNDLSNGPEHVRTLIVLDVPIESLEKCPEISESISLSETKISSLEGLKIDRVKSPRRKSNSATID